MSKQDSITSTKQVGQGPALHVHIHYTQGGVCSIQLHLSFHKGLQWTFYSSHPDSSLEDCLDQWLVAYSQKKHLKLATLPLEWHLVPPFTQQVLHSLTRIPFGFVHTYKEVAEFLGRAQAARAVGGACGRNPFPLLIPCHRVIDSKKGIGGYSAADGLQTKRELLAFEGLIF